MLILVYFGYIGGQNFNIKSNLTLTTIIERTYDNFSTREHWQKLDFPPIAYQIYSSPPTKNPIDMLNENPIIINWKQQSSNYLIEQYALENLNFLFFGPLKPHLFISNFTDYESIINYLAIGTSNAKRNSYLNWKTEYITPNFLDRIIKFPNIFWGNEILNSRIVINLILILLLFNIFFLNFILKDSLTTNLSLFLQFAIIFIFIAIWLTWHITVTYEMSRYLIPWSILLRLIVIISFSIVLDRIRFNIK
jgi:hypothetical protein